MEALGIKETKEVVVGVNELAIELVKHFKDGVQFTDALGLIETLKTNEDFKAKLVAAYENIQAVPAEVKDISLVEGMELVMVQAAYLPKIIEAAK